MVLTVLSEGKTSIVSYFGQEIYSFFRLLCGCFVEIVTIVISTNGKSIVDPSSR